MFLYIIVGITSLSLIGFYSYFKARKALLIRATEQLNSVKSLKKNQIENYFADLKKNTFKPLNDSLLQSQIIVDEINLIMLDTNNTKGLGKSGEVYLVGPDFFMKSKSRFYPNQSLKIKAETQSAKNAVNQGCGIIISRDYRNVKCISSYDKLSIDELNWTIIAEIDYAEATIPITNLRNDLIFISIIIVILIFSIAQIITSDIILPIVKLKNAALKIGKGDFNAKVNIKTEN